MRRALGRSRDPLPFDEDHRDGEEELLSVNENLLSMEEISQPRRRERRATHRTPVDRYTIGTRPLAPASPGVPLVYRSGASFDGIVLFVDAAAPRWSRDPAAATKGRVRWLRRTRRRRFR